MIPFSDALAKAIQEDSLRRAMAGYQAAQVNTAKSRIHRKWMARTIRSEVDLKSLNFELDFWDTDGRLPQSEVVKAGFEVEDPWDEHDPDLSHAVSVFLHRRPRIDRVLMQ